MVVCSDVLLLVVVHLGAVSLLVWVPLPLCRWLRELKSGWKFRGTPHPPLSGTSISFGMPLNLQAIVLSWW